MTLKKRLTTLAAGAALSALLLTGAAQAATTAGSVATTTDDSLNRIERILGDVERAKEVLTGKPGSTTTTTDVTKAQEILKAKEAELEQARVGAMSAASGLSSDKVAALRAQGKAWGDIARDLGVSPRVVGLGDGRYDGRLGGKPGDGGGKGYSKTAGKGQKKGWKHGLPPGQAKKQGHAD